MGAVIFSLLVFATAAAAQSTNTSGSETARQQAQDQALIGHNYLHLNRLADAQANCDAALKLDPANRTAKQCLNKVASMSIDQDLNNADADLATGNKSGALALASKWRWAATDHAQRKRASEIMNKARAENISDVWNTFTPDWLRQVLVALIILSGGWVMLLCARALWRARRRNSWGQSMQTGQRTKRYRTPARKAHNRKTWKMAPLKELPGTADAQTGKPTNLVLDAFGRLDQELAHDNSWAARLLLLRPTPPADYEPAIITNFLSDAIPRILLTPNIKQLSLKWQMPDIQIDAAVQSLQLKTATGIDIGSVARFIASIGTWFSSGQPTISGVSEKTDKAVSIHLAASGGPVKTIAVTTSTDVASGIDAMQLSADRAAFKFLYRLHNLDATIDEIDALSALRQGASQFAQYAETVPGVGDNASTRTSSLEKAAFNFNFFRSSVPLHRKRIGGYREAQDPADSLSIEDEMRQTILLAEGIAHALIGSECDRLARLALEKDKLSQSAKPAGSNPTDSSKVEGRSNPAQKDASAAASTTKDTQKDNVDYAALAKQELTSAIDCFRQLQDWPGSKRQNASADPKPNGFLREQAVYNEAVVWRQMGHIGRSVLILSDLLGEKATDLPTESSPIAQPVTPSHPMEAADASAKHAAAPTLDPTWKASLPDSIRLPALLARLSAFAEYTRDDWTVLPTERAKMLLEDGEKLVNDLEKRRNKDQPQTHDERLAEYMYIEALRALGHVELLNVVTGPSKDLCKQLLTDYTVSLPNNDTERLRKAIRRMCKCEKMAPSSGLYCDLAEAYLLCGELKAAEGYARHATLSINHDERASYLAAQSCFLASKHAEGEPGNDSQDHAKEMKQKAAKYAEDFKGTPTLEDFKRLRKELELEQKTLAAGA